MPLVPTFQKNLPIPELCRKCSPLVHHLLFGAIAPIITKLLGPSSGPIGYTSPKSEPMPIDIAVAKKGRQRQNHHLHLGAVAPKDTNLSGLFSRLYPYAGPEFGPMPINTAAAMHTISH